MAEAASLPTLRKASAGVRVVGLGASAGGLEPLEQFLRGVPAASGLAYLVVQHMDPTHKTLLVELLQRCTSIPVHEAVDAQPIEADTVYVISPNAELTVLGGALRLAKPAEPRGQRLPIDVMLGSLARELGERAIGVVLSGMGSDGTEGLRAIKTLGGLTLAQRPESAQFESMPKNAIAAGCVDIVDLPADLPARILGVIGRQLPAEWSPAASAPAEPGVDTTAALDTIVGLLREQTRHDLALYKTSTLIRRVARRVAVHGLDSMAAYARFLRANPQELDLLFKEMLIGVTSFFRDPEVWRDFQHQVLPALIERHGDDSVPMRAWVVACSTGEEAYSLAMAFTEALDTVPVAAHRKLQIFATDLNADAIAAARSGRFAPTIAKDLSPQRLSRFFSARPDGYQIDKRIRDMVLFAQHDVILDPPFTRLDILSCRNLMIYFGGPLQKRLVQLFHYSLRPGGALLLGSSETVGRAQSLFVPLHAKSRVYWRSENGAALGAVVFPTHRRATSRSSSQETTLAQPNTPPSNLQSLAEQMLLRSHTPPAVLVNGAGDIVYINGHTGRYLEPAAGKANWNIHAMARPAIRAQLAFALRTALQDRTTVELRALRLEEEALASVDITVQAIVQPKALEGMAMVVFRDVPPAPGRRGRRSKATGSVDPDVTEELLRSHEEINALRQEMRASQEELQAANEELQSTNEELQSANEE
ncbi:MAG TPA: chemotaxis protein CheB, partial [Burkholderiaceae bacterium]|nr:chemotaxis protein CheB [Burkholderiaceae bacterium]